MDFTKVSVIIPIYNSGNYLIECLDSVINQTLSEIEVICIDDGSTDSSFDILKDYANNDSRFKIFHQENLGAGTTRNNAIEKVSGEFIIFLDSDDWIEEDMCEKLYNHAKKLDVDLVVFDAIWHHKDYDEVLCYFKETEFNQDYESFIFDKFQIKEKIMEPSLGVIWSKFYKTSLIKDNDIKFSSYKIYNDVGFHFKSILSADKIAVLPEVFYHYVNVGQQSLQSSFRWGEYEPIWYDVMMDLREFLTFNNLMDDFRKEFINYSFLSFINKFNGIHEDYKEIFYTKIKYFYESLKLTSDELKKLQFNYMVFYIHIINSNSYFEFKLMHDLFNGENIY